jgi:hypothetical protein
MHIQQFSHDHFFIRDSIQGNKITEIFGFYIILKCLLISMIFKRTSKDIIIEIKIEKILY